MAHQSRATQAGPRVHPRWLGPKIFAFNPLTLPHQNTPSPFCLKGPFQSRFILLVSAFEEFCFQF